MDYFVIWSKDLESDPLNHGVDHYTNKEDVNRRINFCMKTGYHVYVYSGKLIVKDKELMQ